MARTEKVVLWLYCGAIVGGEWSGSSAAIYQSKNRSDGVSICDAMEKKFHIKDLNLFLG
jgi:hypothetical protein